MPKIRLEPVRGMRDIIPPDSNEILWLENSFAEVARRYGYEYVILPVVESFKVFEVKSGPEIRRSMYVFEDKAGRVVCLRPELTAIAARVYLRKLQTSPKPVKIFYIGKAFRYEEPQRGRYREFIQAGVEYIGEESIYADAELILLIRDYLKYIGLNEYSVKLGNMAIYRSLFNAWGIQEDVQDEIIHYIDKKELGKAVDIVSKHIANGAEIIEGLSKCVGSDPDELLKCAERSGLPKELINTHVSRLSKLLSIIRELGVKGAYADLGFARGLAYYTGIIFEVIPKGMSLSIGGGGRYDTLISTYGGPKTPATGFALGIDRIHLALKNVGKVFRDEVVKIALIPLIMNYRVIDEVASRLRGEGAVVNVLLRSRLSTAISIASSKGYDYIAIIGEKEVREGVVTIKNLRSRRQRSISIKKLTLGELP